MMNKNVETLSLDVTRQRSRNLVNKN